MNLKVFSGNSNRTLAKSIADRLKVPLGKAKVRRFSDGEVQVKIEENVRGSDCYIIQSTCPPVNENLMELLIINDALRRASAKQIIPVLPYYGYARQDRKSEPRVPITSKLVANLLVASGVTRVITMDLHAGQIQGFFDIPVDHLYAMPVFLDYVRKKRLENIVVVSPDAGGVERARAFAKHINADLAIVDKRRPKANEAAIMNVIGNVRDKSAIILDDMVDTAGTLCKVAVSIKKKKAKRVFACASHGVLSGDAVNRINQSPIEELIISDSIPLNSKISDKIKVLSVAPILAEAIKRISSYQSVSELFIKKK